MSKKKGKWPEYLMLIRHDVSAFNELRLKKLEDSEYKKFILEFGKNPESAITRKLAQSLSERFRFDVGDAATPLADKEGKRAYQVGLALRAQFSKKRERPEVVFVSPYDRARATLEHIMNGWPELRGVPLFEEERIREQEHGYALLYNDKRIFLALHPDQRRLYKIEGPYWYRYPQGENIPDIRERNRSWNKTLTREYSGNRVLAVSHHVHILSYMANLGRWDAERFIHQDQKFKPINCGVTLLRGNPKVGKRGRLELDFYNEKLYR